jgi:WD40 repeat protein
MPPLFLRLAPLLACLLVPAGPEEKADIDRLIRQLGADDFEAREEATARLARIGEPALPALRKAAAESRDGETKRRAVALIARIEKDARGELLSISGPTSGYWINRVTFSKDGKQAIATGGGVIWFDLDGGKEVRRVLEKQFARPGLALSADGRLFATGHQNDNDVRLGDAATGQDLGACQGHTGGVYAVAFAPDGASLASASADGTVRLWDVKSHKEVRKMEHGKSRVGAVGFAPDGKLLASGAVEENQSCPVVLWDAQSGKEVKRLKGHRVEVTAVLFTPDGKRLLSAGRDGVLILWDVETGRELKRMTHGPGEVLNHAALSPDGKRALTAGFKSRLVYLWDLETGRQIRTFEGHPGAVLGVAFAPDGKRALSSDTQCTIKLWQLPE